MKVETLKGAKVAIVAMGRSQLGFAMSLTHSQTFDEVWTINATAGVYKTDRMFMMDPPSRFLDEEVTGSQKQVVSDIITNVQDYPIYSCTTDERCPSVIEFPVEEIIRETGFCYMNNTTAYAMAYALYQEVGEVSVFGVDFSYSKMPHFAEAGRACCEFWAALLMARKVPVNVAPDSPFLDTDRPATEKLYGYHRLDDPPHVSYENGMMSIVPLSQAARPPEPQDGILFRG